MTNYTWASAKSGSWNTASSWSPKGGPVVDTSSIFHNSNDTATFATGSHHAYTVSGQGDAASITVIGDHVTFSDFSFNNVASGASMSVRGGAYVTISAGSGISLANHDLYGGGKLAIDHSTVVDQGSVVGFGTTLTNGAQLILSGANAVFAYPLSPSAISIDASSSLTVEGGKTFSMFGDSVAGTVNVNGAGSEVSMVDGFAASAKLSGGSLSLPSLGAGGSISGNGTVASAFTNAGTVTASGGTLTLAGAVTGGGSLAIGAHATLVLDAGTPETITFAGADARLMLAPSATATGFLAGFAKGDSIDIGGASVSRVTETAQGANTVVQAFNGATLVDSFTVAGHVAHGAISLASDHAGGTILTYQPGGGHGGFPGGGWHGY